MRVVGWQANRTHASCAATASTVQRRRERERSRSELDPAQPLERPAARALLVEDAAQLAEVGGRHVRARGLRIAPSSSSKPGAR
jgi:hypothetical protein